MASKTGTVKVTVEIPRRVYEWLQSYARMAGLEHVQAWFDDAIRLEMACMLTELEGPYFDPDEIKETWGLKEYLEPGDC